MCRVADKASVRGNSSEVESYCKRPLSNLLRDELGNMEINYTQNESSYTQIYTKQEKCDTMLISMDVYVQTTKMHVHKKRFKEKSLIYKGRIRN